MSNPYAPPPPGRGAGEARGGHREHDGRPGGRSPVDGGARPERPEGDAPPAGSGQSTPHAGSGQGTPPAGSGQGTPPAGQAPPAPARPPVDPERARAASRRVMHFGLLMLATLVTGSLPLPWQVASVAFAVAALAVGIHALVQVWRSGLRGALVLVLAIGLGFAALLTASTVTLVALWPVQMERQDCLRDALTISAREQCESDYQDSLDELLRRATGAGPPGD